MRKEYPAHIWPTNENFYSKPGNHLAFRLHPSQPHHHPVTVPRCLPAGSSAQSGNYNIDAEFSREDNSSGSQSDPDPASSNPNPSSSPVSSPSPSDSEPSSERTHIILIVGCTLGALLVVSIVAFVLWWC
ncbi:hypothetical protein BD311DRAFT_812699 [Dichomitus squalens]|uniref:Uncharacterized protein n=1 Tax=Dichomitus squalens TaxID=114155 RepID=A0A4Q9M2X7_9APHY|nr:hypothetical protein BD311DRAFT_812699 [Dichomitus squalens]